MSKPGWLHRQPLTRRLALGFGAVAGVVALLVAVFLVAGVRAAQEQAFVTGTMFDAVRHSTMRFQAVLDQETGARGYALSPTKGPLAPFRAGVADQRASSRAIDGLLAGQPALLAASHRVDAAAATWRQEYAEPLIAAAGSGAGTLPPSDAGKRLFDEVRTADQAYNSLLLTERAASADRLEASTRVVLAVLVSGLALAGLALVVVAVTLRRWVTTPIARLGEEARVVRLGDLDHAVRVDGPPELSALARDIDLMRLGLVEQLYEVDAARQEVEASHEALAAQAEDLRRSNRDLEQFAYVASHDLQEPLRKVASFCQLLQHRYSGQLDERADQYIAFAVDGAKRMQALINDLLAFSRVGRLGGERSEVALEDCVEQAQRNLAVSIEESGAVVTHEPLPTVWGEAPLLTALLQNLIGNGIKFRSAEPPHIHIGARRGGQEGAPEWELQCSDNGIGIEAQYADRIFVIFQRLHAREDYEGTGIGLAMAKKIVEHHGGRIWLDSTGGRGTTFRWTLPDLDRAAATASTPSEGALHV